MHVLIVGGDHLGNISQQLQNYGVEKIHHWTGRNHSHWVARDIPRSVDLILVFYDYVNHNLATTIKRKAKDRDLPVVYSQRSWSALRKRLQSMTQKISGKPVFS